MKVNLKLKGKVHEWSFLVLWTLKNVTSWFICHFKYDFFSWFDIALKSWFVQVTRVFATIWHNKKSLKRGKEKFCHADLKLLWVISYKYSQLVGIFFFWSHFEILQCQKWICRPCSFLSIRKKAAALSNHLSQSHHCKYYLL